MYVRLCTAVAHANRRIPMYSPVCAVVLMWTPIRTQTQSCRTSRACRPVDTPRGIPSTLTRTLTHARAPTRPPVEPQKAQGLAQEGGARRYFPLAGSCQRALSRSQDPPARILIGYFPL